MALEQWTVGSILITKLVEFESRAPASIFVAHALRGATEDEVLAIDWLRPKWVDEAGTIGAGVHSFLVQTADQRLVIDTGIGNDKDRVSPGFNHCTSDFLERMTLAGWPPESVTGVVCTHLHVDHVGWNTTLVDGSWVPTFPNAVYYFVGSEFEHWARYAEDPDAPLAYESQWAREMVDGAAVFQDSVKPILDAGLVKMVEPDATVAPGVRLVPSAGHTPAHVSVVIESGSESAVITGDMMHSVLQIARPDWSSVLDTDLEAARVTRERLLSEWADSGTLVLGTHFGAPTGGRVSRHGSTYRID